MQFSYKGRADKNQTQNSPAESSLQKAQKWFIILCASIPAERY